jgi:hypothetical protein
LRIRRRCRRRGSGDLLLLLEVVDAAILVGILRVLLGSPVRDPLARHVRPASDHCRPQQRTSPPEHESSSRIER